jgi:hypothetical protein
MAGLFLCKWLNFPKGGNPYFLSKISCSHVLLSKWCTSRYMGRKFSPEIWAETLKFPPLGNFTHLPRKFRHRARISTPSGQPIKGGVGVKIPFGLFFHLRVSLSKPSLPPPQAPLRRLPSCRNLQISPARALLDVGSPFLRVVFAMDDGIVPNLSP